MGRRRGAIAHVTVTGGMRVVVKILKVVVGVDGPRWQRRDVFLLVLKMGNQSSDSNPTSTALTIAHVVKLHIVPRGHSAVVEAVVKGVVLVVVLVVVIVGRRRRPVHGRDRTKRLPRGMAMRLLLLVLLLRVDAELIRRPWLVAEAKGIVVVVIGTSRAVHGVVEHDGARSGRR